MSDQLRFLSPRVILAVLVFVVLVPFLPLLISGHWDWWEAWVYAIVSILGFAISRMLAGRRNPGLLAERARLLQHADAEAWDKVLAGLEARLAWSPANSLSLEILALAAILAGYALGSYALIANPFFSGMVRIQSERGHQIVTSGPYRWVRHPGYAGALLTYFATPIFLDTPWAFLPAAFLAVVLVIRTNLEDRTLQQRLAGYQDYARRVRFRLLPGVW